MNCISKRRRAMGWARRVVPAATLALACAGQGAAHAQSGAARLVTVVRGGSERGLVRFAQTGEVCAARRCTFRSDAGTPATLTAEAFLGGAFSGWLGVPGCRGIGACVVEGPADVTVTAQFTGGPNLAFLGPETPAALGGLAGADARCQQEAEAAGQPGRYVAYLSARGVDAPTRLAGSRGWVRPDGQPFADRVDDVIAGRVYYPLRLDARGDDLGRALDERTVPLTWTGTSRSGKAGPGTCEDWTRGAPDQTTLGSTSTASGAWFSAAYTLQCAARAHLLCFGVGAVGEVAPLRARGRRAFVSKSAFVPSGGLAQADALCSGEARAAALRGGFLAALSTTVASAASRFDPGGARWVGVDGVPITARGDSLYAQVPFLLPPMRGATGEVLASAVWTGAHALRSAGERAGTCDDWRGGAGAVGRGGSHTFSTAPYYLQDVRQACDGSAAPLGLLCLEE